MRKLKLYFFLSHFLGVFAVLSANIVIPFASSFESPDYAVGNLDGQQSWSVDSGQANVVASDAFDGFQSIQIIGQTPFSQISLPLSNPSNTELVFAQFAVKPYASDLLSKDEFLDYGSALVGFFDIGNGLGEYYVFDGSSGINAWLASGVTVPLDANSRASNWSLLTLRQDYRSGSKVWDIGIDSIRPTISGMGFADPVNASPTQLFQIGHSGGDSFLDSVTLGTNPFLPDWDLDNMPNVFESGHGSQLFVEDRQADADADGTSNLEAYQQGLEASLPGFPSDVVYYLKFSDDLLDSSTQLIGTDWESASGAFTEGLIGKALYLSGDTFTETQTKPDSLNEMSAMSLSIWFKKDVLSQSSALAWNHNRYGVSLESSDEIRFYLQTDQVQYNQDVQLSDLANANWHHLALTWDGVTAKGYLDGQVVWQRSASGEIDGTVSRHPLRVGGLPWESTHFRGSMDELRVYERALTREEIQSLAGGGTDFDDDGLSNSFELSHPDHDPEIAWATQGTGVAVREKWENIPGSTLDKLLNDDRYPFEPTERVTLNALRTSATNDPVNGSRIRAWLHAPVDGDYRFWIKGHSDAALYLSTSEDPDAIVRIASLDDGSAQSFDTHLSQQSSLITLEKDKKYYIEIRHFTSAPTYGTVEVAWEIPGQSRSTVGRHFLSPTPGFVDDDLDGIDDAFELQHFGSLAQGPAEDPDGDGLNNWFESQEGTDPNVAAPLGSGFALREVYTRITGGGFLSSLLTDPHFPNQPARVFLLGDQLETETQYGDYYGQRISGFIHAPVTGDYTFWIAGNRDGELQISSDDDPANLSTIATITVETNYRDFDKKSSQQSIKIPLVAGQKYCFTLLHAESTFTDHLSVAWQIPGMPNRQIIHANFLSTPSGTDEAALNDVDNDGLTQIEEMALGTSVTLADTDGDGTTDADEVLLGIDPLDANEAPQTLKPYWTHTQVGNAPAGAAYHHGDDLLVCGAGEFFVLDDNDVQLTHIDLYGDFDFSTRVSHLASEVDGIDPVALLTVRSSLASDAAMLSLQLSLSDVSLVRSSVRYVDGANQDSSGSTMAVAGHPPVVWLRLKREGDTITGYKSGDGINWEQQTQETVVLPRKIVAGFGLFVPSHIVRAVARFDAVRIEPLNTGLPDIDGDSVSDVFETAHNASPFDASDAVLDIDGNSESNLFEFATRQEELLPGLPLNGLAYYLKFSNAISDSSVNAFTNAWVGNPGTFDLGVMGTAVRLDGQGSYIETISEPDELNDLSALSLSVWFKKETLNQSASLLWNHSRYGLKLEGTDELRFYFVTDQVEINQVLSLDALDDTDWHHLALTYDGATMLGFLDGRQVIQRNIGGVIDGALYRHPLRIGGLPWEPQSFDGFIDEVRIYDRALTQSEINALAGGGTDIDDDGLPNDFELAHPEHDPLVPWQGQGARSLVKDSWENVSGADLVDLFADSRFPYQPTFRSEVHQVEVSASPTLPINGNRLRGWLHAPVDGDYRFWIKGNNAAELYLSTDEDPNNRVRIASLDDGKSQSFDTYSSQESVLITLEKDKRYYIDVRHMTNVPSFGTVSVAWEIPGLPRAIIGKHFISPTSGFVDVDLDGLADDFEQLILNAGIGDLNNDGQVNLMDVNPGDDFDNDGLLNLIEYRNATDPTSGGLIADGFAYREIWGATAYGDEVQLLLDDPRYPDAPTYSGLLSSLKTPTDLGNYYGQRITGFIHAPITGDYTFWIAADGQSEFYLSSDDSAANLAIIASNADKTAPREYTLFPTQKSVTIQLVEGQKYCFQILHKESGWIDHMSVAWRIPGSPVAEVIKGAFLSPALADASAVNISNFLDDDADDLTASEETALGTNASLADTDGDTFDDGEEFRAGTDPLSASSLPAANTTPWVIAELGQAAGAEALANGSAFALSGLGARDAGTSDHMQFLYQNITGNFELTARVARFDQRILDSGAKVGLAIRDSLAANAIQASHVLSFSNDQLGLIFRDQTGAADIAAFSGVTLDAIPNVWLRLTREGDRITAAISKDGTNWFIGASSNPPVGDSAFVGMFLKSNSTEFRSLVHFDDVHLQLDSDADGIFDDEEIAQGTDPNSADTDGDGIEDGVEINLLKTDPTKADFIELVDVLSIPGAEAAVASGDWDSSGLSMVSNSTRGSLDYNVDVLQAGIYRVDVDVKSLNVASDQVPHRFRVSIDGHDLGRQVFFLNEGATKTLEFYTPFIEAGEHTITVEFDNTLERRVVQITQLKLIHLDGIVLGGNGVPLWAQNLLNSRNGIEEAFVQSQTSPYVMEGQAAFFEAFSLAGGLTASPAPNGQWFAEVPLTAGAPVFVNATFENNAIIDSATVEWVETNILETPQITLRRGDALLLNMHPQGAVSGATSITVEGNTTQSDIDNPLAHTFSQTGTFNVTGTFDDGQQVLQDTLQVTVIESVFAADPSVQAQFFAPWDNPALRLDADLEIDAGASLEDATAQGAQGRLLNVFVPEAKAYPVLSRMDGSGQITDGAIIQGMEFAAGSSVQFEVVDNLPDGTVVVEMGLYLSNMSPTISVHIRGNVGGTTFDDGSVLKILTQSDFDENGFAKVRFHHPASSFSTCHHIDIFDGTTRIGGFGGQ